MVTFADDGVSKTNLAYLNGIFAYLYSVKAVHNPEPPEAWVKLYNEMHALGDWFPFNTFFNMQTTDIRLQLKLKALSRASTRQPNSILLGCLGIKLQFFDGYNCTRLFKVWRQESEVWKVKKSVSSEVVLQIHTSSAGSLYVSTSHENLQIQHKQSASKPTAGRSLQERDQVEARGYTGQYSSLALRLLRTNKQGKTITPGSKVTKDEEWTLFIGQTGFKASPGPGGTLKAETVKSEKDSSGHSHSTHPFGEKASFHSAEARDKVFDELLTKVPALHVGNGVPKTNLAYLNGIFAYLNTVHAVQSPEPPAAWLTLYNDMHALGGSA
ncbi:hypothetical protein C8R42DRAFT_641008 [Lentinula raphanica]|nr:hypothetical protein C8R42DRAFT_641008 [Lentinula raphanica]